MNLAHGWKPEELEAMGASSLDSKRINRLIQNIDSNLANPTNSPVDSRKLRELRAFFVRELQGRGETFPSRR